MNYPAQTVFPPYDTVSAVPSICVGTDVVQINEKQIAPVSSREDLLILYFRILTCSGHLMCLGKHCLSFDYQQGTHRQIDDGRVRREMAGKLISDILDESYPIAGVGSPQKQPVLLQTIIKPA